VMIAQEVEPKPESGVEDDVAAAASPGAEDNTAEAAETVAEAAESQAEEAAEETGVTEPQAEETAEETGVVETEAEETAEEAEVTEPQAEETAEETGVTEPQAEEAAEETEVVEPQAEETAEETEVTETQVEEAAEETEVTEPQAEEAAEETGVTEPQAEEAAEETGVTEPQAEETEPTGAQVEEAVGKTKAEAKPSEPQDDRAWYVIHCYSGYENKVKHNLEQRIETMQMQDQIFQVVVPTEDEMEVRDGKRQVVERRVFPGYILVQMTMTDDSWYAVRNTPGVTGFVEMGNEPAPLRPEEVQAILKRMEAEAPKIKVTFKPGQKVRIIDGPFNEFIGVVDEIDMERAKVRVLVSFFGRETPVELDFLQVEKT
jgi:transcriptional antiterminator NusG